MAQAAAGVTATWGGTAIGEIAELKVTYGGELPISRGPTATSASASPWSFDIGTIEIASVGTANVSIAEYGKKATLSFGGPGVSVTTKAICQTLSLAAKTNDIWRFQSTFKIVRE